MARLDRGADDVEGGERQDQVAGAAPAGLGERQRHPDHQHVDVVGREAHLDHPLALVADDERLGQRPAERRADGGAEGGERHLDLQPAERHVDGGQAVRRRGGRGERVAAEGEVDQAPGEVGMDGDQRRDVGVLDLDHAEQRRRGDGAGRLGQAGDARLRDLGREHGLDQRAQAVFEAAPERLADEVGVGAAAAVRGLRGVLPPMLAGAMIAGR